MLAPEEARRRLDEVTVPDARTAMLERVGRLGGAAARVMTDLLDPSQAYRRDETPLDHDAIGTWLDEQGARARRRVFRALHPTLGDPLLEMWTATARDPYQVGYLRRAFRAPRHPELSRAARAGALQNLVWAAAPYEQPPVWFAAWAPYTAFPADIGRLLAVAMDAGDDDVREVLHATVRGDHEAGQVGSHLTTALLSSSHPDDWAQVERLLLAAQRQEGLRSVVLETVDLAHPEAFRRMLGLIREEGLTRFAAVVRAVGVWFGTDLEVRDRPAVDALLDGAAGLLGDPAAQEAALHDPDPARLRLALWVAAFEDAPAAVARAAGLLTDPAGDRRLAAGHLLLHTYLEDGFRDLLPHLTDPDHRVATLAHAALRHSRQLSVDDAEGPVRELLDRLDRAVEVDTGILKPEPGRLDPAAVADALVRVTPAADVLRVADLLDRMSAHGRGVYARLLADAPARHRQRSRTCCAASPPRCGGASSNCCSARSTAP